MQNYASTEDKKINELTEQSLNLMIKGKIDSAIALLDEIIRLDHENPYAYQLKSAFYALKFVKLPEHEILEDLKISRIAADDSRKVLDRIYLKLTQV
ncbi:MAG: hypothetical protein F4X87_07345 [Chloroflexi bacterium]|nr:hypothetical protein [Chloroflexota bacterium]